MALFVVSRWSGVFSGAIDGDPVPAATTDVSMMWSVGLLDLGIVVPLRVATAISLAARRYAASTVAIRPPSGAPRSWSFVRLGTIRQT